ncbi:hypothetical protein SprV_0100333000 [Sparganum proliferum]
MAEDVSEVLDPSCQNLPLLSEWGSSVGVEKRSGSFGCGTMDSLDRSDEVLPFVADRLPLDLLSPTSHPDGLYLPQPLLRKTATTVEGCSVCVDRAVNVGIAQPVLLGVQVANAGILVVEHVLVLTTCATEDSQDG